MKFKIILFLIIILSISISCSNRVNSDRNIEIEKRDILPDTKAKQLFSDLKPESQIFNINPDSDNFIKCKKGTKIYIPQNSFIDKNGEIVTGNVEVEILEVLSLGDFIKTNLQTVSNGKIIQSEGMIFIDAKNNGESITLAKNKKIQIDLPKSFRTESATNNVIFTGNYDMKGNINWTESNKLDKKLIPLPLEYFDYEFWKSFGFERPDNNEGYMAPNDDEIVDSTTFRQTKLRNTFIATKEFEERFQYIKSAESVIGHYTSFYSTKVKIGRMVMDSTISNFYLNNLDKDLWYSDSLALHYMLSWSDRVDFEDHLFSEVETVDLIKMFKQFYKQRLTNVWKFPDVDFNAKNIHEQLLNKGFDENQIDEVIGAYNRQKDLSISRKNKKMAERTAYNSFSISKLGWINCDQYYDDPKAKETKLIAICSNSNEFEFCTFSLIINQRRVALSGIIDKKGNYVFTGEKGIPSKLPIGDKATIVGFSYKNDSPYFAINEITITEKGTYKMNLKSSSKIEIDKKLKEIN